MSKYIFLVLSGLLFLVLAGCQSAPETMATYDFRGLAVISYPETWYVDENLDIVAFSPDPFTYDGTPPKVQFIVGDASVSGYFQVGFNPINEVNLYQFVVTMGLDPQDEVSGIMIDGRQAFKLPYKGGAQAASEDARGWVVIAGEEAEPVMVLASGLPGSWAKYEDTLEDMLMQLSFD